MSNFLAFDTASKHLTVIAQKGEKTVLRFVPDCAMRHSVILMDEIDKALSEAGLTPAECDFFAVVTGPGSFTGIRIGIAAAKGFALAADKPLKGVTAFDLIAYNVNSGEPFLTAVDAAHGHYYVCGYEKGEVTLSPRYLSHGEVEKLGLPAYGFEELPFTPYNKLEIKNCLLKAACLAPETEGVHALYVRKSQAEEALRADKRVEL